MTEPPTIAADFPDGWVTAAPIDAQILHHAVADDEVCGVMALLLEDGTNLAVAFFPAGRRFARVQSPAPPEIPALEERYTGEPAPEEIAREWRVLMESMASSIDEVARLMGLRS